MDPEEVIAQYQAGELTAEAAAELLLPSLKAAGKLTLNISEKEMPVLEALQKLTAPEWIPPQQLVWESRPWLALEGLADTFWAQIAARGLDQVPQCLEYVFLVSSADAATTLRGRIESHTNHAVSTDLPESFEQAHGRVFGRTPPKTLTHADLVAWSAFLRGLPPMTDASLDGLRVSAPPTGGAA